MPPSSVVTLILAGGSGQRLRPLTARQAKPVIPFGGSFRLIDFTLLNCLSSGLERVHVLCQYQAESVRRHVEGTWSSSRAPDALSIEILESDADGPSGPYLGTADAVFQNIEVLDRMRPEAVLVLSADHVYRADYAGLLDAHREKEADVSILTGEVDAAEAGGLGVLETAGDGRVTSFVEKPLYPEALAHDGKCSVNLGVYCFRTRFLLRQLLQDARLETTHDFGRDLLPGSIGKGKVYACPFGRVSPDARPYWRDVGTLDTFFEASMDLVGPRPGFDLADPRWPPGSPFHAWLPAFQWTAARIGGRRVLGWNAVARDAVMEGAQVVSSILSAGARVEPGCELEECVLFPGARVGRGSRLRRAVVDEGVCVPPGTRAGPGEGVQGRTTSPAGVAVLSAPEVESEALEIFELAS